MLVTSETRYVPTAVNMVVLQGTDDRYYYIHRSLYDQCVILSDLHGGPNTVLLRLLGVQEAPPICAAAAAYLPEPLSVLSTFLTLIPECEKLEDIEEVCGALSVMSMSVDFRKLLKVSSEIRHSVKFSLNVRQEYRTSWDRFFQETPTYEEVYQKPPIPGAQSEYRSNDNNDDIEYIITGTPPTQAELEAQLEAMFARPTLPESKEVSEKAQPNTTSAATSGFTRLRGLR